MRRTDTSLWPRAAGALTLTLTLGLGLGVADGQEAPAQVPPGPPPAASGEVAPPNAKIRPPQRAAERVEIAILLDTSGSMDGLIHQARARLWSIVNTLARARRHGQMPDLRVAVFEYGNNGVPESAGYIRQVAPLTDDLDRVSEALFSLRTNGGSEHCGQVIDRAVQALGWSRGDGFRAIFIAGNEPFTQGPMDYRAACKAAIERGIIVNTIHCGPEQIGRQTGWADGARLADGQFMNIDQNAAELAIEAPQDTRLRELNGSLNKTYIGFGGRGRAQKARQMRADASAAAASPGSLIQRAQAKAGGLYRNSSWDLVDAAKEKKVDLKTLPADQLPEEMRKLNPEEREAYVQKKQEKREKIQSEIQTLAKQREVYIAKERAKQAKDGATTFETAVQAMLGAQLQKRGFTLVK